MRANFSFWLSLLWLTAVSSLSGADSAARDSTTDSNAERDKRMAWWREARFGLFIHWGPVALKGTEISWSRANSNTNCPNKGEIPVEVYDNLYRQFNPTNFNAREWVQLARSSGMRYMVLTAKHCDGFCLWHTKVGEHHIGNSPFRRDVCGDLAAAAHRAGMRIGWYYSPMDWRDPDCRTDRNADYVRRMQAQLGELLSDYGRIDLLWFDWDAGTIPWDQENTYRLVRSLQPRIIVNNRLDSLRGEHAADRYIGPNADYLTPEQVIGKYDDQRPWETCMTFGTQWSWKPNDKIKSVAEVIHILVHCAGGDGNLLLNVGPMPDGRIEPRQVAVLEGVGAWLKQNGESVYGTRGGPWKPTETLASTRRGKTVYLHVLRWQGETVTLPNLPAKVRSASVLSGGRAAVKQDGHQLVISLPERYHREIDTVVKLKLDTSAVEIAPMTVENKIGK
ncbi:MAG: alpha-L-fucosidase [Verrucomicrobia bacterium]|nr:alpha-L-fucosidase [Verrucomicrobiota bacterium]